MKKEIINNLIKTVKENKKLTLIIVIGLVGILLIAFSEINTDKAENNEEKIEVSETENSLKEYSENLEARLTDLISSIDNAGEVKVMITLKSSNEDVYAINENVKNDEKSSNYSNSYVIIENKSAKEGIKLKVLEPQVQGVAVVCTGGDDPDVISHIKDAVTTVFGIGSNNVSVSKMK